MLEFRDLEPMLFPAFQVCSGRTWQIQRSNYRTEGLTWCLRALCLMHWKLFAKLYSKESLAAPGRLSGDRGSPFPSRRSRIYWLGDTAWLSVTALAPIECRRRATGPSCHPWRYRLSNLAPLGLAYPSGRASSISERSTVHCNRLAA